MMKKIINIVLGLTFIVTYVLIELYPTIKMGAKIYINKLDFKSLLDSEPVDEYTAHLSDEEKGELKNIMMNHCNNVLD